MVIKKGRKERSMLLQSFPVKQSEFQKVEFIYAAGIDGMGRGGELDSRNRKTPSISCVEDRGRPGVHCSRDQVTDGPTEFGGGPYTDFSARRHSPFPGA